MCLLTKLRLPKPDPNVFLPLVVQMADKDIVCVKKFNYTRSGGLITPHRMFPWPKGVVKVKEFGARFSNHNELEIHEGLHAYTDVKYYKDELRGVKPRFVKMIIPKGSQYIVSSGGEEIVALAMMIAPKKIKENARPKRKNPARSKRKLVKK